jgi:hypothetical protein
MEKQDLFVHQREDAADSVFDYFLLAIQAIEGHPKAAPFASAFVLLHQ